MDGWSDTEGTHTHTHTHTDRYLTVDPGHGQGMSMRSLRSDQIIFNFPSQSKSSSMDQVEVGPLRLVVFTFQHKRRRRHYPCLPASSFCSFHFLPLTHTPFR